MDERRKIDYVIQCAAYDIADSIFGAGHPGFKGFYLDLKASMLDTAGRALIWKTATQWLDKNKDDKWIKQALDSPIPDEADMLNTPPAPQKKDLRTTIIEEFTNATDEKKIDVLEKYYENAGKDYLAEMLANAGDKKIEILLDELDAAPEAKAEVTDGDIPDNPFKGESEVTETPELDDADPVPAAPDAADKPKPPGTDGQNAETHPWHVVPEGSDNVIDKGLPPREENRE